MYSDERSPPPYTPADDFVAGRYRLGDEVGAGAHGMVREAVDELTGRPIVVKLLPSHVSSRALRREVAALRGASLPGVARILDDGIHNGVPFIVLEQARGAPFPGGGSTAWADLAPIASRFLRVLAIAHGRGIFHLDLKPAHVLVHGTDVTLLDFGLARGPGVDGRDALGASGNMRYAAPEQYLALMCDARADLYAAALMIHEALAGGFPFRTLADRLRGEPPRLEPGRAPDVVRDALTRTLRRRAEDRPRDGWELLEALGLDDSAALVGWFPTFPSLEQVIERFGPTDPILERPARFAAELYASSEGQLSTLLGTMRRYVRRGQIERVGEQLHLRDPGREEPSLTASPTVLFAEAGERARGAEASGRLQECAHHLSVALAACRTDPALPFEPTLLTWMRVALAEGTSGAIRRAAYEVARAPESALTADIARVLTAARLALDGDSARALAALQELSSTRDEIVVAMRMVSLVVASRLPPDSQPTALALFHRGTLVAEDQARVLGWQGRMAYARGEYAEAARLQSDAFARATSPIFRLATLLHWAVAELERAPSQALALAEQALGQARALDAGMYAARALWLTRQAGYRLGLLHVPDPGLARAALDQDLGGTAGLIALTEAAIAWRASHPALTPLAEAAEDAFRATGVRPGLALARALLGTLDEHATRELLAGGESEIAWQVLALCAPGEEGLRAEGLERARQAPEPDRRREVLSPAEAVALLWVP